jgi:putative ABC transport system permease protein
MDVHEELTRRQTGKDLSTQDWMGASVRTYVLAAQSGFSEASFNERLAAVVSRVVPSDLKASYTVSPLTELALVVTNTLLGRIDEPSVPNNVILIIIGGVIVALACVNYANLATAQVGSRVKEAGLRKAVGARTRQLLLQHLTETSLKVLAAFVLAFILVLLPVPVLTALLGFNIASFLFSLSVFWISLAIALISVVLVCGLYPALLMARVSTASAARSNLSPQDRQLGRNVLVGFQFAVVSILLILSLVVIAENRVLRETGPQASADPMIVISNDMQEAAVPMDVLRAELLRTPGIKAVTTMQTPPWGLATMAAPVQFTPEGRVSFVLKQGVGEGFFEALDIKLLAGRVFSPERDQGLGADPMAFVSDNVVIDRKLAGELANAPADAVGKTLYVANLADRSKPPQPRTVIGVVENASLKLVSGPALQATVYGFDPSRARFPVIRLESPAHAKAVDEVWSKLAPTVALKRQFAEEIFDTSFSYFNAVGSVILGLAGFAFLIAIIGMLAIATHTMNRRRREIGIRKTLGSTVSQVLRLMLWTFSKPVVIASIIAWPLAFFASRLYLSMFVTRAALTPVPFVIGFVIVLGMTWVAVGRQAYAAARLNAADVLHYE